jgi:ribonucleoside-diphosphate reductase alpha chain
LLLLEKVRPGNMLYATVQTTSKYYCYNFTVVGCEIALRPFSFCNLTELNGGNVVDQEDFNTRSRVAAFFGTLQAGFQDFHYLRDIWRRNTEKDALIGVGITGICNGKLREISLTEGANIAKLENKRVAALIGINPSARCTTIKPSGSTSCVLGTSSGIHAWHSAYYIRNIQCAVGDDLHEFFTENHPELIKTMDYDPNSAVIGIPQKAPDTATLREHENAIQMLERVKRYNLEWVRAGHVRGANTNNVSATVYIDENREYEPFGENEWEMVGEWMWKNRHSFNGLSVLPYDGGTYADAPFQEITKEEYEKRIKFVSDGVDLTKIREEEDNTKLAEELACAGDNCEIR